MSRGPVRSPGGAPARSAFRPAEWRLIRRLRTPTAVQRFLNHLRYNNEDGPRGETLRSFRPVVRTRSAHCLEAVLTSAVILEQHGYPPLVMSLESADLLDHVIYVYRRGGRWGAIARSRDPGLHGRRPVFATARALALSYVDPYVDLTGRVTGYAVADLRELGRYDWRLTERNAWKVERFLVDYPHRPIRSSDRRIERLRQRYREYLDRYSGRKPLFYRHRHRWSELPPEYSIERERRPPRRPTRREG